jgi:hypothetical protein
MFSAAKQTIGNTDTLLLIIKERDSDNSLIRNVFRRKASGFWNLGAAATALSSESHRHSAFRLLELFSWKEMTP